MGPPGSGKGTLSSLCVQHFGWHQLSTGNLCREHVQNDTDIGKKIKAAMKSGDLVSDEVIADMVKEWLVSQATLPQGIIFDGYPRTKKQAELLYAFLQNSLSQYDLVLVKLHVDADLVVERILSRVSCSNKDCQKVYSLLKGSKVYPKSFMECDTCGSKLIHRSDDTEDTLKNRIHVYYQNEQDIIDFYVQKGMSIGMINGAQTVQGVFNDFKKLAQQNAYVC